ncbi:MAG: spermidine/putrescine ABC transporter substrate-binding protein [Luteolibacter sp.]|jgi:spermidine/putrescine transport system substrate-binding protein|nr:spermidine/putrescine ABC transporter substrate-binding protein [Luteolibacter sp.]
MMKRRHFLTTTSAALAAGVLPGCSGRQKNTLRVYSWADYLDPDLASRFEKEASCQLRIDTFDSNEAMYAKLAAGATGYDVLVPSSYMVKTLIRENRLQPLDHANIPNVKHIDAAYLKRALDPAMAHSVPYMMAPTCIAWLGGKVSEAVPSYRMFDRADLKGRMTLLDDMREVLGAALRSLGFSLNSKDPAQLALAREVAARWKKNIAKFDNEQYKSGIASGEFHLVQGYAGDLLQVADENEDIVVKIPDEGTAFSCDDLCIPKDAAMVDLAHRFIDFLNTPDVAAKNMEFIAYRAPNQGAYPLLSEDFRGNEALFPSEEVFARCEPIDDLGDALGLWSRTWDEVKAS